MAVKGFIANHFKLLQLLKQNKPKILQAAISLVLRTMHTYCQARIEGCANGQLTCNPTASFPTPELQCVSASPQKLVAYSPYKRKFTSTVVICLAMLAAKKKPSPLWPA